MPLEGQKREVPAVETQVFIFIIFFLFFKDYSVVKFVKLGGGRKKNFWLQKLIHNSVVIAQFGGSLKTHSRLHK